MTPAGVTEARLAAVPNERGGYVVLREGTAQVEFLAASPAGRFTNRGPAVDLERLRAEWIAEAQVLYIGKAGSPSGRATLRTRLRQYLAHGRGEPVGHWGGRLIWQLEDAADLVFCWRATGSEVPGVVERCMLEEFRDQFGRLPFANLRI